MSSPTRLIVRGAPLSPTFKGTLNQFYQAMLDRIEVLSPFGQLQFQVGGVQPSSNVGPWLKDGTEWWVWDETTKTYVPITVNPLSLSTILNAYYTKTAMDAIIANYSTTTAMNAAIAAAVAGSSVAGRNLFKAKPSANQDITHVGAGTLDTDVVLGTSVFDEDSNFGSNVFTAPVDGFYEFFGSLQVSVPSGAATEVFAEVQFVSSAGDSDFFSSGSGGTGQRFYAGSTKMFLSAGDTVKLSIETVVDDACVVRIGDNSYFTGMRVR